MGAAHARILSHAHSGLKSVMSSSVLGAVQALLHGTGEQGDARSLAKQVSICSSLLRDSPALYGVALHVLASAYQLYLVKPDVVCVCMCVVGGNGEVLLAGG